MRSLSRFTISALVVATLGLFSVTAQAQSRTDCLSALTKPGACFSELAQGEAFVGCNFPGESDVVEGLLIWENLGSGDSDFGRTNPDGREFVHVSDRNLDTIYCPWDTVFSGLCTADSAAPEYLYYGTSDLQNNGYFAGPFEPSCPWLLTSRGEVTRPIDGDTLEIRTMVKYVNDPTSPTGCRVQECRILK